MNRTRLRDVGIAIAALGLGIGATVGVGSLRGDTATASGTIRGGDDVVVDDAPVVVDAPSTPGTPAGEPTDAVDAFLAAEAADDHAASYRLLDDLGRSTYGDEAGWTQAHADFFPVVSHRIVSADENSVVTDVVYRSSIDEVVGLVPARARVTWAVVPSDGGWLVDYDAARLEAQYPDDDAAVDAASRWASALHDCEDADQYDGGLVASADLVAKAQSLCDGRAADVAAQADRLGSTDGTAIVSAFGPEAAGWARTVGLSGPINLTVVLAPVDDRWLVIGLLP